LAEGRILVEEVLADNPRHPQALSVLGDLFLKQHSPQQALDCFHQAFLGDSRPYLILKMARALKEMGQFEKAMQELERVLVVKPRSLSFLKEKAILLNRMKKFDQALETFEKIKEISPEDPFVQKEILRLRSRSRPETQVLKELQAVVGMSSKKDDAQMHGLLAQKLKGAGLVREAAAEYRVASTLDPGNPYFLKQQGFCHYREGSYDEAIRCLEEAFRGDPSDYVVLKTLEKCYEAQGKLKEFLDLLQEALQRHTGQTRLLGTIKKVRKKLSQNSPQDP
jgi:tetratricopeptide (TPR) repeat protein